MILNQWIDQIGNWNPQLLRELKGRLTPKNVGLVALFSAIAQGLLLSSFADRLPRMGDERNPYCIGTAPATWPKDHYYANNQTFCIPDLRGHITINWSLWWTEIFTILSIIGVFTLVIVGTYLLIQDLAKEEKRGTLNFVRLSPQSAWTIVSGKMQGVPSLVYGFVALALPLYFWSGIRGGIPIHLILLFQGVVAVYCLFIYQTFMLGSLVSKGAGSLKAFLSSGFLFYFLTSTTAFIIHGNHHFSGLTDGILVFNPLHLLPYILTDTGAPSQFSWFEYVSMSDVTWFGLPLWYWTMSALFICFLIFGGGIYVVAQAFKRRFHNQTATLLSKKQSYGVTAIFTLYFLGFSLQTPSFSSEPSSGWMFNLCALLVFISFGLLCLISILSPPYQSIQDWSRYQAARRGEWFWGERSPALWAVVINGAIAYGLIALVALVVPLDEYRLPLLLGIVLQAMVVFVLAAIVQRLMLNKFTHRNASAAAVIAVGLILPLLFVGINGLNPELNPTPWLWTIVPMVATKDASVIGIIGTIIAETVVLITAHHSIQKRLQTMGQSELKTLLSSNAKISR